jgi:hypothetical protein
MEAFDDVEETTLVIEFVFCDPEPMHDLLPLSAHRVQALFEIRNDVTAK